MPGTTYRTVLVGTDGSSTSLHAVDRAAVLARNGRAQLLIACASRSSAKAGAGNSASVAADDVLSGALARARAAGADDIDTLVLHGDPVDELAGAASSRDVDLVVVGNRGMNSLSGRLLGSVPANLSHRVACDVLIVHTTGQSQ